MESLQHYKIAFDGYLTEIVNRGYTVIGNNVHGYIANNSKYPHTWIPFLKRYLQLVTDFPKHVYNKQIYTDILATMISKHIRIVDLPSIVGPTDYSVSTSIEFHDYSVTHSIFAKMTLVKILKCSLESIGGAVVYDELTVVECVKYLYDELLLRFVNDSVYVDESGMKRKRNDALNVDQCIDDIVSNWLLFTFERIEPGLIACKPEILADAIPFMGVSHLYWLWLHMTAARTTRYVAEFITVVYNFDFLLYCSDCAFHYKQNIKPFFKYIEGEICTDRTSIDLIYTLHDMVNKQTNAAQFPIEHLSDYLLFWTDGDDDDDDGNG